MFLVYDHREDAELSKEVTKEAKKAKDKVQYRNPRYFKAEDCDTDKNIKGVLCIDGFPEVVSYYEEKETPVKVVELEDAEVKEARLKSEAAKKSQQPTE